MQKKYWVLLGIIVLFWVGCSSSPSAGQQSQIQFNGFWQLPNGQFHYIKENAWLGLNAEGGYVGDGVFTYTNTHFILHFAGQREDRSRYTVVNANSIRVNSDNNSWMNGVWRKRNDISITDNNRLMGYWEYRTEDQIRILHIWSSRAGAWYTCDLDYNVTRYSEVEYDPNDLTRFSTVIRQGTELDGVSIRLANAISFDGQALIIGTARYVKK